MFDKFYKSYTFCIHFTLEFLHILAPTLLDGLERSDLTPQFQMCIKGYYSYSTNCQRFGPLPFLYFFHTLACRYVYIYSYTGADPEIFVRGGPTFLKI